MNTPMIPKLTCKGCGASFVFIEQLREHALSVHYKYESPMREWLWDNVKKTRSFESSEDLSNRELTDYQMCEIRMVGEDEPDIEGVVWNGREKLNRGCYRVVAQHGEEA